MTAQAYTSTVVAPIQLAIGLVLAAATAAFVAAAGGSVWIVALVVVVILLTAIHLSVVRLSIGGGRVVLGQGPWNRGARVIAADSVVAGRILTVRWAQAFGVGIAFRRKSTRYTVRAGPAVELSLQGGEQIRISTPDPEAALTLLPITRKETDHG